jgi:hypothetical protein
MIAYKLFRVLKNGDITPLFINKTKRLPLNEWMRAEPHLTKGFKFRPHWHSTSKPIAPHLSMRNREWYKVEIKDYKKMERPKNQGGIWYLSNNIKIIKKLKPITESY